MRQRIVAAGAASALVLAACASTPEGAVTTASSPPAYSVAPGGVAAFQMAQPTPGAVNREEYRDFETNPVHLVLEEPVSTFSVDVDTASYAVVRRFLNDGMLPPTDAVRVEELINYFDYAYATPKDPAAPFGATVAVAPTPWNPDTQLVHIGLKGFDVERLERPRANLVFVIDVSGSMDQPDKLPLVKRSLRMLVNELEPEDTVSIIA
jgi:Ca-activated chloride channel family protein